ncbi:hypothetical protein Thimo_0483 [Thioflavicoccus mobilis 8321]|uniref:Uncharacterized protein n=1 Tax=Thioflavicoccus mobilis 8321 TaxID=765912 RepID=L0GVL2_9GAMM|nr:hypothetical protein Thimo_0483 [Thioflavicoccus mobilis 8321]
MLGNPMLDVAIGLAFFYMVLGVIVTVLQEFLASTLKWRARNLRKAIIELIGEAHAKDFYAHPLIFPLFRGGLDQSGKPLRGGPSYIPKRSFALAVIDLQKGRGDEAATAGRSGTEPPAIGVARFFTDAAAGGHLVDRVERLDKTATELLDKVQNHAVRQALEEAVGGAASQLKGATDVIDSTVRELESLFDNTMNRAAGWYKVKSQRVAFAIALVLAVLLNADSVYIAQRLWDDDALRTRTVAAAEAYYQSGPGQTQVSARCGASAEQPDDEMTLEQWQAVRECTQTEIADAARQIASADYPIGWPMPPDQSPWLAIVGQLMTALALSLGSSFWFDLLARFMKVRMSGKREETTEPVTG